MKFFSLSLVPILAVAIAAGCQPGSEAPVGAPVLADIDIDALPVENAVLGYAPDVAPRITRNHPAKVVVEFIATEGVGRLADGVEYTFWTFNDAVPGPMIRVREGDYVEFHMMNHENSKVPHNIDLHSVKGPGGGAEATLVAPGERASFSFRALQPGVYVYHCATPPVGLHVANGMYGLIVVEPADGWPEVDKEFYVMQSEFYTEGNFGEQGLQAFSMERALREDPGYVVFNGSVGALTGDNAIQADVGDRVRLFVGNGGPNLLSSFHVIGEIFDTVYHEGGSTKNHNVQTTMVPAGGATIVEFTLRVPGDYIMVDHSLFRAFNKGAVGILTATGDEDPMVFKHGETGIPVTPADYPKTPGIQGTRDAKAQPEEKKEESPVKPVEGETAQAPASANPEQGMQAYRQNCASCHMADGKGLPGTFPALAGSSAMKDSEEAINIVLKGKRGTTGMMPPMAHLSDDVVADILTYVRQAFGNSAGPVTASEVSASR